MRLQFLTREFITVENAPPGGGLPTVTLPPASDVSPPTAALPVPPLPSPPSPVLPTPDIDIADEFVFDEVVLGNPATQQEALDLLGFQPTPPPSGGPSFTCVRIEHHFDGSVSCHNRPQPDVSLDFMG